MIVILPTRNGCTFPAFMPIHCSGDHGFTGWRIPQPGWVPNSTQVQQLPPQVAVDGSIMEGHRPGRNRLQVQMPQVVARKVRFQS